MSKKYIITLFALMSLCLSSCIDDMNTVKLSDTAYIADKAWREDATYESFLAKIYAGFSASGNQGPNGYDDLVASDQGEATWVRSYFTLQEYCTDECRVAWNSDQLNDLQFASWSSDNNFFSLSFNRMYLNIAYCNEYLRETTTEKMTEREISATIQENTQIYRNEVKVLRAMNYYFLMDLFANVPIIKEEDGVGDYMPEGKTRAEVFQYIEEELLNIGTLPDKSQYGRVNANVVAMVLAKMYLNAEVYIGQNRYADCLTQLDKIFKAGYAIEPNYKHNFNADNHLSTEIIYGIVYDSKKASSWGGSTFLIGFETMDDMDAAKTFGVSQVWSGGRVPKNFFSLFQDKDLRGKGGGIFWTKDREEEITDLWNPKQGYSVVKYTNLTRDGKPGQDTQFPDTDFPLYRLADAYLMYAECVIRGAGGDMTTALAYVNELQQRAGLTAAEDVITAADMTLDFIRDERGRELYWEGHRRTDLIRLNSFIGNYSWPFKGGSQTGIMNLDKKYLLYPIPAAEFSVNTKLKQNDGY